MVCIASRPSSHKPAAIPLITVIITILLDGWASLPSLWALASLVPIAVGIGAASWNAPIFQWTGFGFALLSAVSQACLNVSSKKAIASAPSIGAQGAQRTMVFIGLGITLLMTGIESLAQRKPTEDCDARPPALTALAVAAYHLEYNLSFMFVRLVPSITYGAFDAVRRLCIILAGKVFFVGNDLTTINKLGIVCSILGAIMYAIASNS